MGRYGLIVSVALVAIGFPALPLSGHPHTQVEQQALVSVAANRLTVTYYLAASASSGAHMFDHLDTNGDARIDSTERRAFGEALIRSTTLTINGQRLNLTLRRFALADRDRMAAGRGVVRIQATTPMPVSRNRTARLNMRITYRRFEHRWFIQPFFSAELRARQRGAVVQRPSQSSIDMRY